MAGTPTRKFLSVMSFPPVADAARELRVDGRDGKRSSSRIVRPGIERDADEEADAHDGALERRSCRWRCLRSPGQSRISDVISALLQNDGRKLVRRTPNIADPAHSAAAISHSISIQRLGHSDRPVQTAARDRGAHQRRADELAAGRARVGLAGLLAERHGLHDRREVERRIGQREHEDRHHDQRGAQAIQRAPRPATGAPRRRPLRPAPADRGRARATRRSPATPTSDADRERHG